MSTTNLDLLTKSHRAITAKRRAKQNQVKEVLFDDNARREFLTGFHKRKLAKAEAARAKAKEKDKQDRLELRREKRRLLREQAHENASQVEKAYGAESVEQDDEWHGIADPSQQNELARDEEYENEETLATVTVVEDFDPDTLIHGPSHPEPSSESRPIHSDHDTRTPRSQPTSHSTKKKIKPTKIRYETKDARKREQVKQRARRTEKAERAGGKASRKPSRGTKGKPGSKR